MKSIRISLLFLCTITTFVLFTACNSASTANDNYYTRGIGLYPGLPSEDFSPSLKPDYDNYRNIAFHSTAYHSSSYDYNLTAQLVTDGVIISQEPAYLSIDTPSGNLPIREREWSIDNGPYSKNTILGDNIFLQYNLHI